MVDLSRGNWKLAGWWCRVAGHAVAPAEEEEETEEEEKRKKERD